MYIKTIAAFLLPAFFAACTPQASLYKGSVYQVNQLSATQLDSLKLLLTDLEASPKDTIIIKFDFNYDNCWSILDQKEDDKKIDDRIYTLQNILEKELSDRPQVSFYQVREPGTKLNKYKSRSPYIRIDSSGLLRKLLFTQRASCGTSAIILPSGQYLIKRSDSHFEALRLSGTHIQSIISKK